MADLHQQLLAETQPIVVGLDGATALANLARTALRVVVELHAPRPCRGMDGDLCRHLDPHDVCTTCGSVGDPRPDAHCSTVQAIARELGVQEDNHHG